MVFNIDEETQKALNQEAEEINSRNATPALETNATEEVDQTESTEEVEPTETEGREESKKGYQARVQELNQKAKAAEERARSLEQKLAELTSPVGFQEGTNIPPYNPLEPLVAPGEEIDVNELNKRQSAREQRILQQASANAQLIAKQSEAINRINSEASEVVRLYPQLDPDSDNFNRELSDIVAEATEAYVKDKPYTASVKQFVAKLMKPYQRAADKEVSQASENIAKQVSQAALRPTSIRKEEKQASEKSIAELEAELGIVIS